MEAVDATTGDLLWQYLPIGSGGSGAITRPPRWDGRARPKHPSRKGRRPVTRRRSRYRDRSHSGRSRPSGVCCSAQVLLVQERSISPYYHLTDTIYLHNTTDRFAIILITVGFERASRSNRATCNGNIPDSQVPPPPARRGRMKCWSRCHPRPPVDPAAPATSCEPAEPSQPKIGSRSRRRRAKRPAAEPGLPAAAESAGVRIPIRS